MNLAPVWVGFLQEQGFEAVHWSTVGDPSATDATIMEWARRGGYVVLTHDLDFSALLAVAEATGPSVIQVRTQDVLPEASEFRKRLVELAGRGFAVLGAPNDPEVYPRFHQITPPGTAAWLIDDERANR